ncbi:hypothetical protein BUALT_Bualt02G0230400 [Buddleja alternifolia]|uniref:Uncharacterized protein n=1 Tax=Buddleja alternifolia TaxID=168488 RepID=A0AAV6YBB8_9LAMI|nr:hypothetical protein BUALT_Bualt02G0230400 [Buddleja alternifolia]
MFAIICRRKLTIPLQNCIFIRPQFYPPILAKKSFSSSDVHTDDPKQSFTISYLINSCGLSSNDAVSTSKKVCIKSPENPDAVLQLLSKYGFTNAHIPKLVVRWPQVLVACPDKTLSPKLEFFCSFGVPVAILAQKLSLYPLILQRSLENYLIPSYNYLKSLVQSDEKVVSVFRRAPRAFAHGWQREISTNIAVMRERGVPESSIVSLVVYQPSLIILGKNRLSDYMDRAVEMGFDKSKIVFIHALQVFGDMSESTLKRKMEVYGKCGWSESDITGAFLRFPLCMTISEKKIIANMDFLVNEVGCKPGDVAQSPVLLGLNLDKRMRPRWLVVRILKTKKLLKKTNSFTTLFKMSEEIFLKNYIMRYQEVIPQLLDFYQGKLSLHELVDS